MKYKTQKGFTLIELLVVIAIIGVLSTVVLSSLNSARAKGANAAVKENLHNIRSQAEVVNDNTASFAGVCTDPNVVKGVEEAGLRGGIATTDGVCNSTNTEWAASAPLKAPEGTSNYWCVDNTGSAKGEADPLGAATVCP